MLATIVGALVALVCCSVPRVSVAHVSRDHVPPLCVILDIPAAGALLDCTVQAGQYLHYDDIRAATESAPAGVKYAVTVTCSGGGRMTLPWPYRAANVIALRVQGCGVDGFFSENFKQQTLPDELEVVEVANVTIKLTATDMYNNIISIDKMSEDARCGQRKATRVVTTNQRYEFVQTPEDAGIMLKLMRLNPLDVFLAKQNKNICRYPNLKYLEESGNLAFSKLHFKLMTDDSEFPALEVYNVRENNLPQIPQELRHVNFQHFPKLRQLDLSDNNIRDVNIVLPSLPLGQDVLINLQGNKIEFIPREIAQQLLVSPSVVLDVRHNPLRCSCDLVPFRQYLLSRQIQTNHRGVSQVTCRSDISGVPIEYSLSDGLFDMLFCAT